MVMTAAFMNALPARHCRGHCARPFQCSVVEKRERRGQVPSLRSRCSVDETVKMHAWACLNSQIISLPPALLPSPGRGSKEVVKTPEKKMTVKYLFKPIVNLYFVRFHFLRTDKHLSDLGPQGCRGASWSRRALSWLTSGFSYKHGNGSSAL